MTAIAKVISNARSASSPDFDTLKTVAVFCGVGLLASLVLILSGVTVLPAEPSALNVINWI
jgi:hypothetical protein